MSTATSEVKKKMLGNNNRSMIFHGTTILDDIGCRLPPPYHDVVIRLNWDTATTDVCAHAVLPHTRRLHCIWMSFPTENVNY